MNQRIQLGEQTFFLQPLSEQELDEAVALCDSCVGKNLYPKDKLRDAIRRADHFFYLLKTQSGDTAGYLYYYLTDAEQIARDAKLDSSVLYGVLPGRAGPVWKIQSAGLREDYRGKRLALQLIRFALHHLRALSAAAVFAVCWKMGEVVPVAKTLRECGFTFLTVSKAPWYDDIDLICPYCKGRCRCDAEIYYQLLDEGNLR